MVGFLLGFPVLLCNAAMWLHIMYRPKEEVKCDNYVAESGTFFTSGMIPFDVDVGRQGNINSTLFHIFILNFPTKNYKSPNNK